MVDLSAASIEDRFAMTEARPTIGYYAYVAAVVVVGAALLYVMVAKESGVPAVFEVLLPWLLVCLLGMGGWMASRRRRLCRSAVAKAWEHLQLDEWDEGEPVLDGLLNRPIRSVSDRAQAFLLLAAVAERRRDYDAACLLYEILLQRRIGDSLQLRQTPIALAAAKLRNEELTDAVDLIGRLERVPMPAAMHATYDLVRLLQQVVMGQNEDAVATLSERRGAFQRYLSTRAGFGYAFLAAALHHLGRNEEAGQLWADATTLIRADRLVEEYGLLSPLAETYTATEHTLT